MREIKFRGWDKEFKGYVYTDFFEDDMFRSAVGNFFKNSSFSILEQYTGLKDKNGREIYEGDVIAVKLNNIKNHEVDKIAFDNGCYTWRDYVLCYVKHEADIIGNIHENPELLEGV
jgi:uncharacterized phage protein (TIGR01671 family)